MPTCDFENQPVVENTQNNCTTYFYKNSEQRNIHVNKLLNEGYTCIRIWGDKGDLHATFREEV